MRGRHLTLAGLFVCALLAGVVEAHASDAVKASVSIPSDQPAPMLQENGHGYTPGTYAIGTIQLYYVVSAYEFPTGPFASFDVGFAIQPQDGNGRSTDYPAVFTIGQIGSSNLVLTPATSSFTVPNGAWTSATRVTVSIPAGASSEDGTDLVGNLRIASTGYHLDTVTNIQVHIRLVHPTACLKLYNFLTDGSLTYTVSATEVNVNRRGAITATNPYGQFSDNVLVANLCPAPEQFDVRISLDSWFQTSPSGNPGNAVFLYFMDGEADPATFDFGSFGAGTPQGQTLCLSNITVPSGDSMLGTVHMAINKDLAASGLGTGGEFTFRAQLFAAGTGCGGDGLAGVMPENPASASMTYTIK